MWSTMFNHVQPMFNPFGLAGTTYGQIWPFWVKKGRFRALLRPPTDISGWAKRPKLTPPEVENIIQPCSPNVQPIWGCRDCLWPNMAFFSLKKAILGGSRAPQWHLRVVQKAQTDPPGCGEQCSTLFSQCSTHLGSLGLPMATFGHSRPKKAIKWH